MFSNPAADAALSHAITTASLVDVRAQLGAAEDDAARRAAAGHIAWLESQLLDDERRVRKHCTHVWVPAGLDSDDARVCAQCGAER